MKARITMGRVYVLWAIVFMIVSNYPKINSYLHNDIPDQAVKAGVPGQQSSLD